MYQLTNAVNTGDVYCATVCGVKKWKDQFDTVDGIVYFIDATDRDRFEESKQALDVCDCRE